ncbi:hypothetical protein [Nitrolancea hollandica]|uniref:hypothetical protein n=1 Tax=Nitrolancea hollandica TaxID=1206749 RepID=UPI000316CFDB|nr:hypothetical protein [Nitrolancea hollandica]
MSEKEATLNQGEEPRSTPHHVRIPGFLVDDDIGLGDVVKKVTYAVGIRPCGSCEKRAEALNRWMRFSG